MQRVSWQVWVIPSLGSSVKQHKIFVNQVTSDATHLVYDSLRGSTDPMKRYYKHFGYLLSILVYTGTYRKLVSKLEKDWIELITSLIFTFYFIPQHSFPVLLFPEMMRLSRKKCLKL